MPRSLDPLPAESLPGYVLRLAHRLDMSPTRLRGATGLDAADGKAAWLQRHLRPQPEVTEAFAHATRLTAAEVTDLTLASLAARYPPLDLAIGRPASPGPRRVHPRELDLRPVQPGTALTAWPATAASSSSATAAPGANSGASRSCSPAHTHRRLLRHACPACDAPVHQRRAGSPQLLPLAAHPVHHPAACRNPTTTKAPYHPCGHRLDRAASDETEPQRVGDVLRLQQRLLTLLGPDQLPAVTSVGQPTTPARYFVDLRIMSALLQSSWPTGQDLVDPAGIGLVDDHVRRARDQIASARAASRKVPDMRVYDKPPLDAATTATLLYAADRILTGDAAAIRPALRDMFDAAPFAREWTRRFLVGDGHCSPGLHTAAGTEAGTQHVMKKAGLPPRPTQPAPRLVDFDLHHIPQYLPTAWYDAYFANIGEANRRWLRRAVPVLLARMRLGGSTRRATALLGLPWSAGRHAVVTVAAQLRDHPAQRAAFDSAVEALAQSWIQPPTASTTAHAESGLR